MCSERKRTRCPTLALPNRPGCVLQNSSQPGHCGQVCPTNPAWLCPTELQPAWAYVFYRTGPDVSYRTPASLGICVIYQPGPAVSYTTPASLINPNKRNVIYLNLLCVLVKVYCMSINCRVELWL